MASYYLVNHSKSLKFILWINSLVLLKQINVNTKYVSHMYSIFYEKVTFKTSFIKVILILNLLYVLFAL